MGKTLSICPRRECDSTIESSFPNPAQEWKISRGSFSNYYDFRTGASGVCGDPRLKVLMAIANVANHMHGSSLLDIGCNSGDLTLAIATAFQCRAAVGLEIDSSLVSKANHLRLCTPQKMSDNVAFFHGDFLEWPLPVEPVDVILCLSVTKWIHLEHGDDGIRRLFTRVRQCLRPGGLFVLEPQAWQSYRNKLQKPKEGLARIVLRPASFADLLISEIGGFQSEFQRYTVPHKNRVFRRTMHFFWRNENQT